MDIPFGKHASALARDGWTVIPEAVQSRLLNELVGQLPASLARRDDIRKINGVADNNDGTLHHLIADHECYVELLKELEAVDPLFKHFFSGNYILNSYGGVVNRRDTRAYVHNVHRDIRFTTDSKRFMLNVLVMLDDFTLENGATHLLSGSQNVASKPDDDVFRARSSRALGKRGSVVLWDSRLWHATGHNQTDTLRRALTLTLTCPFFKQQLDYPRLLGYDHPSRGDPYLRQVIGFNARVPASLEDYYVSVEQRFYQRGQDD